MTFKNLANKMGQSVKVLHVIDLPNYKAITITNSPGNPIINEAIFDVTLNLPCPEYILPVNQGDPPTGAQEIADFQATAVDEFMTIVGQVANMDGVALVDYFEFPTYDALVIRLQDPNNPILKDSRFVSNQIETHTNAGHIAQVEWSQILPNSIKRTVPSNNTTE